MFTEADRALAASDPVMAGLVERLGPMSIAERRRRRGQAPDDAYGTLLRAIIGQQLSTKAARTIYERVIALFDTGVPSPEKLLAADEAALRGAGLSGRKVEYLRDLAAHVIDGELELDRLEDLSDDEVIEEVTAVRGSDTAGRLPARVDPPALHEVPDNGLARTPPMGACRVTRSHAFSREGVCRRRRRAAVRL